MLFYSKLQAEDGHWTGDYGGPLFLMAGTESVIVVSDITIKYVHAHVHVHGGGIVQFGFNSFIGMSHIAHWWSKVYVHLLALTLSLKIV